DRTGSFTLISKVAAAADQGAFAVGLGGDSAHLRAVFASLSTNLGAGGDGNHEQTYVSDVAGGSVALLNRGPGAAGAHGADQSVDAASSADGGSAGFSSQPTNPAPGGDGRFDRVFVRRLATPGQEVELVSRPSGIDTPAVSADVSVLGNSTATSA